MTFVKNEKLAIRMAGEISLAENPGVVIKKWRDIFNISQKELSRKLQVSPSVISDYESGRRKSPGTKFVSRIVTSLLVVDEGRGGKVIKEYGKLMEGTKFFEAILAIKEFAEPRKIKEIIRVSESEFLVGEKNLDNAVYGYTVVDSVKAILELSPLELSMIYGSTTQRALFFTRVKRGRSPLLAIKLTSLRPSLVVLHGIEGSPDPLALELAKRERLPLAFSHVDTVENLVSKLRELD
ncbi:MAG: helix-turn-helix domain-containing protein [Candidatus Altiarchaeota archaeon]|nr:helix-turn-helix domain-containing protein [Candidatus Altiarchaeota archaeon]